MSEQLPESEGHPVLAGLVALLAVGVAIGLLVSGVALTATSALGVRDSDGPVTSTEGESVTIPKPSPTPEPSEPLITLEPRPSDEPRPTRQPQQEEEEQEDGISLSAASTSVAPGEKIDLTGVYPGGEGAVLAVQRLQDGDWVDFVDVTARVSNETFNTFVITSRTGPNTWRMRDVKSGEVSNEVRVQVG